MAATKSFTDIQQSKKLAEILPMESADMYYCYGMNIDTKIWSFDDTPTIIDADNQVDVDDIPCWSLAALFAALQNQCGILETRLRTNKKYNVFATIGDFVYNSFEEYPDGIDMIDGLYELTLILNKEKLL